MRDVSSHPSSSLIFLCLASSHLLAWVIGGLPHLGERWASEGRCWEAGPQQVRPSEDPSPSLLLGLGRQGGGPANQLSPSFEALLPLSLCRNHKIPVQRQEMGLFLALWGKKKRMLPFCSKIYGVCAGQAESLAELKASAGREGVLPQAPVALPLSMAR